MSKIKKITVSNLKAVTSLTADFNGCTGIITGGNNKGKSSFLKSLPDRIRGIKPEVVLRHGEKNGSAEMELTTGEKFVWTFDDKKEKLVFISEKNIPQSVTKDLARVYFPPVFDVDEFLNSTPAKQKATLQKLTGIDFTEFDRAYKNAYEERTFINKRVAEEKARLVLVDPDVIDTPVDTTELEKELNGIEAHNLRYNTVAKGMEEKRTQVAEIDADIAELQKKIVALQEKKEQVEADITKGQVWMDEPKNQLKNNKQESMQDFITWANPERWKIFETLKVEGQNDQQFNEISSTSFGYYEFLQRHNHPSMVCENNEAMTGSYLLIDPQGRLFENSKGVHTYSSRLQDNTVSKCLSEISLNRNAFIKRGGLYNW